MQKIASAKEKTSLQRRMMYRMGKILSENTLASMMTQPLANLPSTASPKTNKEKNKKGMEHTVM